jgi:hypothetical protein
VHSIRKLGVRTGDEEEARIVLLHGLHDVVPKAK